MLYIFELKEQLLKYKRCILNKLIFCVIYVCVYFTSTFAAEDEGEGMQLRIKEVLRYSCLLSPFDQKTTATGTVALMLGNTTVFCYNKKVVSALTNACKHFDKRSSNRKILMEYILNKKN